MKVYQVGGCVRDRLLGIEPKDIDYVVVGATEEMMFQKGFTRVGAGFPVFLHPHTGEEWALARKERKTGVGYNGFNVVFDSSVTLEEDLSRRDLTINAMAFDVAADSIIDPYGGQDDLKAGLFRHVSDAFAEDPVRVLRTARFAARYADFNVHTDTVELMKKIAQELNFVPQERIWAEFEKGLMEKAPTRMFNVLYKCDALSVSALTPYAGFDEDMLSAVKSDTPLHIRFGAIASAFSRAEYARRCIPLDCSRVATAFNDVVTDLIDYHRLNHRQRIELLMRLRAFNPDSRLLNDVLEVWKLTAAKGINAIATVEDLMFDFNRAKQVDATEIASTAINGSMIGQLIMKARVKAISP